MSQNPPIIIVTGVIGAGKSTTCQKFNHQHGFHVPGDKVQGDAAIRAFPFRRDDKTWRWSLWPSTPSNLHLNRLLALSLNSRCKGLYEHAGPVLAEACILCRPWFRKTLIEEIRAACGMPPETPIHYLNVIPEADVVLRQIRKRAEEHEGRRGELNEFGTLGQVQHAIQHARDRTTKEKSGVEWEPFDNTGQLKRRISELLEAPAKINQ